MISRELINFYDELNAAELEHIRNWREEDFFKFDLRCLLKLSRDVKRTFSWITHLDIVEQLKWVDEDIAKWSTPRYENDTSFQIRIAIDQEVRIIIEEQIRRNTLSKEEYGAHRATVENEIYAQQRAEKRNESGVRASYKRADALKQRTPLRSIGDPRIAALKAHAKKWGMAIDHVYPLQGKLVSGLHVWENLQLLNKRENSIKSNRFVPC